MREIGGEYFRFALFFLRGDSHERSNDGWENKKQTLRAISTAPIGGASPEERSSVADAPAASASSDRSSTVATGRSILFLS